MIIILIFLLLAYDEKVFHVNSEDSRRRENSLKEGVNSTTEFLDFPEAHVPRGTIRPKEESILFDLLQKRMIAIVFAFTALESFANESIPDDFIFRKRGELVY